MQLHSLYQREANDIHPNGVLQRFQEQESGPTFIQPNILLEKQSHTTTQAIEENVSDLERYF